MKLLDAIKISATNSTPYISADPQTRQIVIKGRSLPTNVVTFYQPIIDWIKMYGTTDNEDLNVKIQLSFLNSSSHKRLLDIFEGVESLQEKGCKAEIEWFYKEGDEDIYAAGTEFLSILKCPLKLVKE
ncbi:MAG: DUF1987 domain-containing protein [Marinilabiliaceae bacterium]|jgi:hypothetical protein|nr:DUF1987 domain-containing protein [Bacteroidales bacterium]MCR5697869.1 DUF1987 domain-containing protein [Marinilabiliaceae bacterium]